ncbi:leucine rich repeat-containing protein [Cystoisospora suis]|uniref:Leucine rich repeat-containing protein n=1 Tax=Cystoisospora suis TaxID=483139 RepID=A0A2C6KP42_9APIC|nr:leucine rich repeat-containing protein [Cystoisospora suis]
MSVSPWLQIARSVCSAAVPPLAEKGMMTADGIAPVGSTGNPGSTPMSQGQGDAEDDESLTQSSKDEDHPRERFDSSLTEKLPPADRTGSEAGSIIPPGGVASAPNREEPDPPGFVHHSVPIDHQQEDNSQAPWEQDGPASPDGPELSAVVAGQQEASAAVGNTGSGWSGESEQKDGNEMGEPSSAEGNLEKSGEDKMSEFSSPEDEYQLSVRNRFSLDRPTAEETRTRQKQPTEVTSTDRKSGYASHEPRQPSVDEESEDGHSADILLDGDSSYTSSAFRQTPSTPGVPQGSTPRVTSVSHLASSHLDAADAPSVEETALRNNVTPPQHPGVDRPFVLPEDIDLSHIEPTMSFAIIYQQKCEKMGVRPNAILVESLMSTSSTKEDEDHKPAVHIACPGNMRRVFCRRLDDLGMIPAVLALAYCGSSLQSLNLSYNRLSDDGAVSLAALLGHCSALRILNVKGNDIKAKGTAILCESFRKHSSVLEDLDVSLNPVGDNGARALAEWLRDSRYLEKLNVDSCQIDMDGLIALAAVLRETNRRQGLKKFWHRSPLQSLSASLSHIGSKDFTQNPNILSLCSFFFLLLSSSTSLVEINPSLVELSLAKQSLRDQGIKILVPYLKMNHGLHTLDLSCNQITFFGSKAICDLLRANTPLEILKLDCNRLAEYGARYLALGLEGNRHLHTLHLNKNHIPPEGLLYLANALLVKNRSLLRIALSENHFDSSSATAFGRLISPNSPRPVPLTTDFTVYEVDGLTVESSPSHAENVGLEIDQKKRKNLEMKMTRKKKKEEGGEEEKEKEEGEEGENEERMKKKRNLEASLAALVLAMRKAYTATPGEQEGEILVEEGDVEEDEESEGEDEEKEGVVPSSPRE